MGHYQQLKVWIKAKDLAVHIYRLTSSGPFKHDFGLRDQLRRAAVSISSNIAEGDELHSDSQSIRHFYIARGSTAEVLTQSIIAKEVGYITQQDCDYIEQECNAISGMLSRLIRARQGG
jgi:four helix bundle protein